jgi:hypothetical protein
MKIVIPIAIVLLTAIFIIAGTFSPSQVGIAVGEGIGTTFTGSSSGGTAPEQVVTAFLQNVKRRNWDGAYSFLASQNKSDESTFVRELGGRDASLRTFSTLSSWDLKPLHANSTDAEIRATLRWSTPVGVVASVRDLRVVNEQNAWRIVWPEAHLADVPAQVVPVNYLRWDLVTHAGQEWGNSGVDGPHVRIVSMNAVSYNGGSVIMGEALNEDTVPAFVNVNATLIGKDGKQIGEESSFDKILHVLLPKQVTPYRIDFPTIDLQAVKNVQMDIKTTLVPASADPVIGVMNQAIDTDAAGKKVLKGQLLNQSGQIVNISHVIATFYDTNGKVIWVSDGYVDSALYPQTPESFSVEVPNSIAGKAHNYHVVVNQYSLEKS